MKILAVSTWFPIPPDNGSKARTYNLLSRIGGRHTLDLLALSESDRAGDYLGQVHEFCRRAAVVPEPQFRPQEVRSWLGFFTPTPRYFRAHHSRELDALAGQWTDQERYDAALAVTLGAAPYVVKLSVPFKVLDQHNVESQTIKRRWEGERSLFRKLRYAPTWMKAEQFERVLVRRFDAVTVVSERERHLMERLLGDGHGRKVCVIPNGIGPDLLEYRSPEKEQGVLAFTGALAYQPNYDAAERLCREILPQVRVRFPQARVRVTGSLDGVDVSGLAGMPGVELTGYLDDVRSVVSSASALVVPLRYGGGTRLKILEAMALGTPVVSTPIGAEGLEVADGVHILLGETTAELAEQTLKVLADRRLADRIARGARELVRDRYQWPAIAGKFERVLVGDGEVEGCDHTEVMR